MDTIVPLIYPGNNATNLIPFYHNGISKEDYLNKSLSQFKKTIDNFERIWEKTIKSVKMLARKAEYYKLLKEDLIPIYFQDSTGLVKSSKGTIDYITHSVL